MKVLVTGIELRLSRLILPSGVILFVKSLIAVVTIVLVFYHFYKVQLN